MNNQISTFSITLLVSGTTIGAGVLALPLVAGQAGFVPSVFVAVLAWAAMLFSAYVMVGAYLGFHSNASLGAIYGRILGAKGMLFVEGTYVFLFGALLTAYLSGLSSIITSLELLPLGPVSTGFLIWCIFAMSMCLELRRMLDGNKWLVFVMLSLFGLLIGFCVPSFDVTRLRYTDGTFLARLLPVFFGSFGFHGSIPAFCKGLNGDQFKVKKALFWGTFLALLLYLVFMGTTLACLPLHGAQGSLDAAIKGGAPVIVVLGQRFANERFFHFLGVGLSLLAIATSFLGVTAGVGQFVHDRFPSLSLRSGRLLALLLPAVGFFCLKTIFLNAVVWVGVGCGILFGIFPSWFWIKFQRGRWSKVMGFGCLFVFSYGVIFEIFLNLKQFFN